MCYRSNGVPGPISIPFFWLKATAELEIRRIHHAAFGARSCSVRRLIENQALEFGVYSNCKGFDISNVLSVVLIALASFFALALPQFFIFTVVVAILHSVWSSQRHQSRLRLFVRCNGGLGFISQSCWPPAWKIKYQNIRKVSFGVCEWAIVRLRVTVVHVWEENPFWI